MANILPRLARLAALAAGAALIGTAVLVSVEVILRKLFLISLNTGTELSSYVLAIVASWGLAFALYERTHVRIDILVRLLPKRLTAFADTLALLGLTLLSFALTWFAYGTLAESLDMGSRSMTPLSIPMWIPQGIWVAGLALFSLCCGALLVRATLLITRRQYDGVSRIIGTASVEAEALNEANQAEAIIEKNAR